MRHVLVKLALIGFLCRALVPAGFMPAPIADGGPIRFCDGGAVGALLAALAEDHDDGDRHEVAGAHHDLAGSDLAGDRHEHDRKAKHEGWDRCPIGAVFALAVLASDFALPLLPLEHALEASAVDRAVKRLLSTPYDARAPPLV